MPEPETDQLFTKFEELITTLTDFNKNALHLKPTLIDIQDALTVQNARLDALEHLTDKLRTDAEDTRGNTAAQAMSSPPEPIQKVLYVQEKRIDLLAQQLDTLSDLSAQMDIDFKTHHHMFLSSSGQTGDPICEN